MGLSSRLKDPSRAREVERRCSVFMPKPHMSLSQNRRTQNIDPHNTIVLNMGTPKKVPLMSETLIPLNPHINTVSIPTSIFFSMWV